MKLNREKTVASLQIDAAFSAGELEELISKLAVLRSDMTPPVPQDRPNPASDGEKHITIEDEPAAIAARLRDGRIRLWLRNRGTGWMAYNMSIDNACALRDYLVAHLTGETGRPDLFGDGIGQAH
jgi:hypothetical protein